MEPSFLDNQQLKRTKTQEMDETPRGSNSPPSKKKLAAPSSVQTKSVFEATLAGANQEIRVLHSRFAEVLSQRAAADSLQLKDVEHIVAEARQLEISLKEKKKLLKDTLDIISSKLQG